MIHKKRIDLRIEVKQFTEKSNQGAYIYLTHYPTLSFVVPRVIHMNGSKSNYTNDKNNR